MKWVQKLMYVDDLIEQNELAEMNEWPKNQSWNLSKPQLNSFQDEGRNRREGGPKKKEIRKKSFDTRHASYCFVIISKNWEVLKSYK